jgi:hypothetical protein
MSTAMTAQQKLKWLILLSTGEVAKGLPITAERLDEMYDADATGLIYGAAYDLREGEVETGLHCPSSRHYESKAVASQAPDGTWVGWTYWHGGGKHGEPEAIDWMEDAYDVACVEEEKLVVVQTFSKVTE